MAGEVNTAKEVSADGRTSRKRAGYAAYRYLFLLLFFVSSVSAVTPYEDFELFTVRD